jgi:flagellar basal-body rod protein FlgC
VGTWTDSLNISASGLTAQRTVMDVISNNIANADTTRTASGGPYRREMVELAPAQDGSTFQGFLNQAVGGGTGDMASQGGGVEVSGIAQDPSAFQTKYDPSNPDAVNGYVQMPNVDISTEMVDMIAAQQAYQANVTAFDAAKQMDISALALGK